MRKFTVVLVSSLIALAGFAGSASASATIDLIWDNNGSPTADFFLTGGDQGTLSVILTAGPNGSLGAGVSVDYTSISGSPDWTVISFASTPSAPLSIGLGSTTDSGTRIQNIGAGGFPPGLTAGSTFHLGSVTFQYNGVGPAGSFTITVDSGTGSDNVLDGGGNVITGTSTFNSALTAAPVPEPGTISLLGMGLGGLYVVGRRSARKS